MRGAEAGARAEAAASCMVSKADRLGSADRKDEKEEKFSDGGHIQLNPHCQLALLRASPASFAHRPRGTIPF
jgi:hypothetical protein